MKIYAASSWRNAWYPEVVKALRDAGHMVYDFRDPSSDGSRAVLGMDAKDDSQPFKWQLVGEDYMDWTPEQYREKLQDPLAVRQFANDIRAMEACEACVLVLPCGRSAHTEAGWFAGRGLKGIAFIPERQEPELMYKLFSHVPGSLDDLVDFQP